MKTAEKTEDISKNKPRSRPRTAKARENRLINLAMDLAEEKLMNGTASSQIISYFLGLASPEQQLKNQMMTEQVKLVKAKTGAIEGAQELKELYQNAVKAMSEYCMDNNGEDDYEEELY